MILESLKLSNFRQFFGQTPTLRFSREYRNVTAIHGANGSGKTALLNAFTWALYGEFSRGFQLPEELVNKRAIRVAKVGCIVEANVELRFRYAQRQYTLTRKTSVERTADAKGWRPAGRPAVHLEYRDVDGVSREAEDVDDIIGRILPADLHWYFFFDGERIERLVQTDKDRDDRRDIAAASKKLLGIEVLKRAVDHLGAAKKDLEAEHRRIGDAETDQLYEQKQQQEIIIQNAEARLEELERNIEGSRERKNLLRGRLREKQEVREVQLDRERLENEEEACCDAIGRAEDEIRQSIRADGYVVFLNQVAVDFQNLLDELRRRGELPAGIKQQFVQDLLNEEECICGTPLTTDTQARNLVEKWMSRAGLADVEDRALRMRGEMTALPDRGTGFWSRVDRLKEEMGRQRQRLEKIRDDLYLIRERLRDDSAEEVSSLERQLEETETKIDDDNRDVGVQSVAISQAKAEIAQLEGKIDRHEKREARQRIAHERVRAASEAIDRIKRVHGLFESELRVKLQKRIQELFRRISITPYIPKVEEDFSLTLYESAGGTPLPVAASTGESQVLSISFIGSLIALTKEFQARKDKLPGPDDVSFPIVMDSPFGSLDPHHREQVAKAAPDLADQAIVMVSKSQWLGQVEKSLGPRVGRQYVLTYFSPRNDIEPDSIVIDGKRYDLLKHSPSEFEYTEIREVTHG